MNLTPNQLKAIRRKPSLEAWILNEASQGNTTPIAKSLPLPTCSHRGKLLDTTTCRCKVYSCGVHGTCSNSKRAGLTVCPCDNYLSETIETFESIG